MSDSKRDPIEIKDQNGKVMAWIDFDELNLQKAWMQKKQEQWFEGCLFGFPEATEEEKYLRGISGVITKERGLVFWHDDGKFYEPEAEYPALKIPLTQITEKLTVIRGATSFDF